MLNRSRYHQPFSRNSRLYSQSRMARNIILNKPYHSPQASIQPSKHRYRLIPINNKDIPQKEEFNKKNKISSDIIRLQNQLYYKQQLKKKIQESNSYLNTTKIKGDSSYELKPQQFFQRYKQKSQSNNIWQNLQGLKTPSRKNIKLYKLKSKKNRQIHQLSQNIPIINYVRIFRNRKETGKQYLYQINQEQPLQYHKHKRYYSNNLHFRKIAHVILFIIYLRNFNQRMRRNRQGFFKKYVKEQVQQQLLNLKNFLIQSSQPFFLKLISYHNFDYQIMQNDGSKLKKQKQKYLKQLIQIEINCIEKAVKTITNRGYFSDLLYYLCKHGNYANCYQINTLEELNLTCISEKYGYMRADKYLQQSALLSLVFFKILLFNIFFQPNKISIFSGYTGNKTIIFSNTKLIGNIFYELFIDIQDSLLDKAPHNYNVANWQKSQVQMKFAESMTIKPGFIQKNELISGLEDHKLIKETYGTKYMLDFKKLIEELMRILHQNIIHFHERIRKKYY